jgi:hypothetical protein
MKTREQIFIIFTLVTLILLTACNAGQVRITGTIRGLDGTVKVLAEIPGERGLSLVAQQEVQNGQIDLRPDRIVPPAQLWLDVNGERIIRLYLDSYKGTRLEGAIDSLDGLQIAGSPLMETYLHVVRTLDEKFGPDIDGYNERIFELTGKGELTRDEEIQLGKLHVYRQRVITRRADYVRQMIKNNPRQEISLFLIKEELSDSLDLQRELFHAMALANKESNIYKLLESRLQ